ncbi:hypothetical protein ACKVWH_000050 [Pyricularia oryzae]
MPTNHSGKTDRRRLRQIGSSLTYAELAAMQPSRKAVKQPSITMEKRLQQLWADVIGIEASAINAGDNFLRLGGDSITAIRTGITPSTVTRSAWALLTTQYTRSNDVLFAATVNGRQASIRGIENCVGPTISTIPIAVGIDWAETIEAFLARRQSEMMETVPHEQFGLQNIYRALGGDLDPRHI